MYLLSDILKLGTSMIDICLHNQITKKLSCCSSSIHVFTRHCWLVVSRSARTAFEFHVLLLVSRSPPAEKSQNWIYLSIQDILSRAFDCVNHNLTCYCYNYAYHLMTTRSIACKARFLFYTETDWKRHVM